MNQAPPPVVPAPAPRVVAPPPPQFLRRRVPVPPPAAPAAPAGPGFFEKYKYWIVIALVILVSGIVIVYLVRQNSTQETKFKEAQSEYRVRAEQYAQKRGDELATQMARKMIGDYLKRPGSRHDVGDPGILPDLGCMSDWETNVNQRCDPQNQAITTDIRQIGSTAPPPIDGPGSVKLDPANADDDFQGSVEAPLPTVSQRQQHAASNKAPAT